MASERFTDETLNRGFLRCKDKIKDEAKFRDGFNELRANINGIVRGCADNIRVVIYIYGCLDEPLVFSYGKEENRLVITMKSDGKFYPKWSDRSVGKYIRDGLSSLAKRICSILPYAVKPLLALTSK